MLDELNKLSANRQFKKGILFARAALRTVKKPKIKVELIEKLGRWYDQYALSQKNIKQRIVLQNKALYYFRKLKKHDKFEALRGIGTVYHHQYKPRMAMRYYHGAEQLKPNDYRVLNDLGNAYQRSGTIRNDPSVIQRAEEYYRISLRQAPSQESKTHPLINLALLSQRTGKKKDARHYASRVIEIIAKHPRVIIPQKLTELIRKIKED